MTIRTFDRTYVFITMNSYQMITKHLAFDKYFITVMTFVFVVSYLVWMPAHHMCFILCYTPELSLANLTSKTTWNFITVTTYFMSFQIRSNTETPVTIFTGIISCHVVFINSMLLEYMRPGKSCITFPTILNVSATISISFFTYIFVSIY